MMDTSDFIKKLENDRVKINDRVIKTEKKLRSQQLKLITITTKIRHLKKGEIWCDRCEGWFKLENHPCWTGDSYEKSSY